MPDANGNGRRFSRDSTRNTLIIAIGVSIVCSVLVAGTSVLLKPLQLQNQELYRQRIVLSVAGLYEPGADIEKLFAARVESRLVDLEQGTFADSIDPRGFDVAAATRDPDRSVAIPVEMDLAGLRRRSLLAPVFLVRDGADLQQIILPVYGAGLWSTMYGFLALQGDATTVRGLRFYEHAETPGLGDQIDDAGWLAQWPGKRLVDDAGAVRLAVARGQMQAGPDAEFAVDGLSGATLTGRGVTRLLQYWAGPHGFGPFLANLRSEAKNRE